MAEPRDPGGVTRIAVKVAAGASVEAIRGWQGGCLRVSLVAAPERGKANAALITLLARALDLPKSAITITRGEHSAHKTLCVAGLSEASIHSRLRQDRPGA